MNLFIIRIINYKSKNKNKDKKFKTFNTKFNSNKSDNKNKNKNKIKFNKLNKISTSTKSNTKKFKAIKYDYYKKFHSSNCWFKNPETVNKNWQKKNKLRIKLLKKKNKFKEKKIVWFNFNFLLALSV